MAERSGMGAETAEVMGPWGRVRSVPAAIVKIAEEKMRAVQASNQWLSALPAAVECIVRADVTDKTRLSMLRALADKINQAVAPQAACKRGCDGCCKIQVEMSGWEAGLIGEELGMEVLTPAPVADPQARSLELLGQACGFLKDGDCSIYEARPVQCRVHHNLSLDASMCQPDVVPEESMVPAMNLLVFHAGYMRCSRGSRTSDISDYFAEARRRPRQMPSKTDTRD